jgi:hypothetical protein
MVCLMNLDNKIFEPIECFFCNKSVLPLDFREKYGWTLDVISNLQKQFGFVPEKQAGKIGNKIICEKCLEDLDGLLEKIHM